MNFAMFAKLYSHDNDPKLLRRITGILDNGGIMIYPTDSAYAIGCNALKPRAVDKICELKNTDPAKSLFSVVCYDMSEISRYARFDNRVFKLMKRNLPGAFTFILEGSNLLPKVFRNRKTLGIRMPANPIVLELAKNLEAPIMTSTLPLNDGCELEYTTDPELIRERWCDKVDIIIDGGVVPHEETTIVDCTGDEIEIVRQGKAGLNFF